MAGAANSVPIDLGDLLALMRAGLGVCDILTGGRLGDNEAVEDDGAADRYLGFGYLGGWFRSAGGEERAGEGGGGAEEEHAS